MYTVYYTVHRACQHDSARDGNYAVIAAAVRLWRQRLSACVKAGGGHRHFEHCLSAFYSDVRTVVG